MAVATLKIIPGTLPAGYCYPSNPQTLNNDILTRASVSLSSSSFTVIITSASQPPATDRDKLWMNTADDRLYRWGDAHWISRHPFDPDSKVRYWYMGDITSMVTFDGGAAGGVALTTGPMWVEDTDFAGRVPLHAGALPTSGTVTVQGDDGGADQITLADVNTPPHVHDGIAYIRGVGGATMSDPSGESTVFYHEDDGHTTNVADTFHNAGLRTNEIVGTSGEAFDSMNPYRVGYWIKRSGRTYYTAA